MKNRVLNQVERLGKENSFVIIRAIENKTINMGTTILAIRTIKNN